MSTAWVPPRRTYHLRIFVVSLIAVVSCLVGVLFAVRMEAIAPAVGLFAARDQEELRAPLAGLAELGWYEGEVALSGKLVKVRVNSQGDGTADPAAGQVEAIVHYKLKGGTLQSPLPLPFHKLQAGDKLWPGQVLAHVRADDVLEQVQRLQAQLEDLKYRGETAHEVLARLQCMRELAGRASVRLPEDRQDWQVLKVHAEHLQAVKAGDALVLVAPIDGQTGQPRRPVAMLEIMEKHFSEVRVGQDVRFYSTMYNQRLHGHADGRIERLEPLGEAGPNGQRRFRAWAAITRAPFPMLTGASFKAEIAVGRKQVYRIILEQ